MTRYDIVFIGAHNIVTARARKLGKYTRLRSEVPNLKWNRKWLGYMYKITMIIGHSNKRVQVQVKVALSQKILENFYVSNINIPNHYPEQKIWISCLLF